MAGKSLGQKFKSILVFQILLKYTDIDHPLTASEIKDYLLIDYGIEAEEHSIRRDIKELQRLYEADEVMDTYYQIRVNHDMNTVNC